MLDTGDAGDLARSGLLLDARAADAYAGVSGGGHIPRAVSFPATSLAVDGLVKTDEELHELFTGVGVASAPAGVYCGGGTSASLEILALARLGITAALYPGSWSAWSSDPSRPVATGNDPG